MKKGIARVISLGIAVFLVTGALYFPVSASEAEEGQEETATIAEDSGIHHEEDSFVESYVEENDGENENNQEDPAKPEIFYENDRQDEINQEDLIVPEPSEVNDSIVVEKTLSEYDGQASEVANGNESNAAGAPAEAEENDDLTEVDDASTSVTDSVGLPLLTEQEKVSAEDSVVEPGTEEEIPAVIPANDATDNDIVTGWYEEYGARYYADENGNKITGWMLIDGKQYYFDPDYDGAMVTGEQIIDGSYYRFRDDGSMVTGWYQDPYNEWVKYYYLADGKKASGWQKISEKWYYFDSDYDGRMSTGEKYINGSYYCFRDNGSMVTGWYKDTYGDWYYYLSGGKRASGWRKINEKWYYFDSDYDGRMSTGEEYINGSYYRFRDNGSMFTGWYQDPYGDWCYYLSGGNRATGWQKISGKWYYFSESWGGMLSDTLEIIKGKGYKFSKSGALMYANTTGWVNQLDGNGNAEYWYYVNKGGALSVGWQRIGKKWYYFSPYSCEMYQDRWGDIWTINGKGYYFSKSGAMQGENGGWIRQEKYDWYWYYANKGGSLVKGWKQIGGKWYYFDANGGYDMYHGGTYTINQKEYTFAENGVWTGK